MGKQTLSHVGDVVKLTDAEAKDAGLNAADFADGNSPLLLPKDLFDKIGFTAVEKAKYTVADLHSKPKEFRDKWSKALELHKQWLTGTLPRAEESAPAKAVDSTPQAK